MKVNKVKDAYRAFIAIPVSSLLKQQIDTLKISLSSYLKKHAPQTEKQFKWISGENLHVTLKFLGEISSYQANEISDNIKYMLKNVKPFKVVFTSLIGFPSLEEPHTVALSPHPQPPVIALAYKIDDLAKEYGIQSDKQPFRPHLTIAKLDKLIKVDLSKINIPKLRLTIDELRLYHSEQSPQETCYKILERFPLT